MRFHNFINERDVALLPVEKCKDFKGKDKIECKRQQYEDYIRDIEDAIKTSRSRKETDDLKRSLKWAKGVLFKLRSKK